MGRNMMNKNKSLGEEIMERKQVQKKIIERISEIWEKNPEWRLGQLLMNVSGQFRNLGIKGKDCWEFRDEEILKDINKWK